MISGKSKTLGFLPNLCAPKAIVRLLGVAAFLALLLTLATATQGMSPSQLPDLAYTFFKTAMFAAWVILGSTVILCFLARIESLSKNKKNVWKTSAIVFTVTLSVTFLTSFIAMTIMSLAESEEATAWDWSNPIRYALITILLTLVALRYFYIFNKAQDNLRDDCNAEYAALQSRMRPHFLFNSLNTISQLTLKDPTRAEEALLDLADIFRTTLSKEEHITLGAEIGVTLRYLRMEELRVGKKRLQTILDFNTKALPMTMEIPPLLLQPLVENAVYHGIQPSQHGGVIGISIHDMGDRIDFAVTNPIPPKGLSSHVKGNHIAQENMKNRLAHAYGENANLRIEKNNHQYRVSFSIPKE